MFNHDYDKEIKIDMSKNQIQSNISHMSLNEIPSNHNDHFGKRGDDDK